MHICWNPMEPKMFRNMFITPCNLQVSDPACFFYESKGDQYIPWNDPAQAIR